jgi:hypothetical protein
MRARRALGLDLREWLFFGLVIAGWALFVIVLGKDMSWDFRNYHWYAPYAFLTGRMGFDIGVAHQATYYNPLLDIPFYWLAVHTPSWFALGVLGAVQGANIIPLYLIARALLADSESHLAPMILSAICMTGGLTISLAGTTYYDNIMSLFVLTGLAILIVNREALASGALLRAAAISAAAGLITGSAVGLKLPEAPYALGFAATLAIIPGTAKQRTVRLAAGGIAGLTGVLLFAGYWFMRMDQVTGNPLFPYFNEYFHSPLVLAASYRDTRFLPHDALHALLDPILFSIDWRVANDLPFTDIRIGLAYVCLIATGAMWLLRRGRLASEPLSEVRSTRVLLVFAIVTYAGWISLFAIYRYILTLEMLAPIAIVAGVGLWPLERRTRLVLLALIALGLVATTRPNILGRAPLGDPYVQVKMPAMPHPQDSMVLMTGEEPMGYLVPSLPGGVPVIRIDGWLIQPQDGSHLTAVARKRVASFGGDLYLIANPYEINRGREAVRSYGLHFTLDDCQDIDTNLGGPYLFCKLTRIPGA